MKKLSFLLAFLTIFAFACQDNLSDMDKPMDDNQKELIIDEAMQQTLVDDLLNDIDFYSWIGDGWTKSAEFDLGCPTITIVRGGDGRFPCTVTLDFGEGCDKGGKVKSGKMIMTKTGPWKESGSVRTISFDGYNVDGTSFSGSKTITNVTEKGGAATFEIAANLELSYTKEFESKEDGEEKKVVDVSVTRAVNKTQTWLSGFADRSAVRQVSLTGTSDVTKKVGEDVKSIKKTFTEIIIQRGCRFPQGGVTEFDVVTFNGDNLVFAMDYSATGDAGEKCKGECDCYAILTVGDDQESLDLSDRWWNKTRKEKESDKKKD